MIRSFNLKDYEEIPKEFITDYKLKYQMNLIDKNLERMKEKYTSKYENFFIDDDLISKMKSDIKEEIIKLLTINGLYTDDFNSEVIIVQNEGELQIKILLIH